MKTFSIILYIAVASTLFILQKKVKPSVSLYHRCHDDREARCLLRYLAYLHFHYEPMGNHEKIWCTTGWKLGNLRA